MKQAWYNTKTGTCFPANEKYGLQKGIIINSQTEAHHINEVSYIECIFINVDDYQEEL